MKRLFQFFKAKYRGLKVVSKISFRNLVRQFRRNLLLGIGIAVGMCILVVTTSFTNGLTDILFNKIMVYMTGHISLNMRQSETRDNTSTRTEMFHDFPRMKAIIEKNVEGISRIDENVGAFARTIGNGKTGFCALVGLPDTTDMKDFTVEEGDASDIFKTDVQPGILLYKNAAKDLNVGLNDTIKLKFETVYKQPQGVNFKIVGLIRSENIFMDVAAFVDMKKLRELLNLLPEENQGINIVTVYPEDAAKVISEANKLYAELTPEAAGVVATISQSNRKQDADVFAIELKTHPEALTLAKDQLQFIQGKLDDLAGNKNGIILTETLASSIGAPVGTKVNYSYFPKYSQVIVERELAVTGIIKNITPFKNMTALTSEDFFYETFFRNPPKTPAIVAHDASLFKALLPEWELLPRTADTDSSMKKYQKLSRDEWKGARLDVGTMFEFGSMIVQLQNGLNTVSLVAVFILFFVILIGVVNTMRMSIRERTREIGTTRAIGMRRGDVRSVFVFEIVFLSIFACLVGIMLGLGLIALISSFTVDLKDNPFSMFFVNKHFYFLPTAASIFTNAVTIVFIAFIIAFFTARRAAKMRAADALRHYE
jgi:ABC-type lipoprotein release transport system permease subunit